MFIQSFKSLYRYAKLFDSYPSLKFVLSDVLKSALYSVDLKAPKWFSPEMRKLCPSLLDSSLAYIPSKSACAFVERQFQQPRILVNEEMAMASISSYLQFCDAVLAAASKNYRVNLFTPALLQSPNSVAFERDKRFYSSVQLERQQMTSLRDLTIGSLLVNYPTEILSRNPFESVLNR